jgi:HlyD family secretion protein
VAVDKGAVTTEVATTGTLQPAQTRSLSFAVSSTVTSVPVRAGTTVTAGQVLATVDSTDAAEAVGNARDSLDQAESALTEARSKASSSSGCGSNVAAAYTSATASPSASPSASASASPPASASTSPSATAKPKPAATSPKPGSRGGSSAGSCTGQQGGSDPILSAQQRVTSATTTLAQAEEALEGTTIRAPIAGRILSVGGKVGSQVGSGSAFITLADVYDMQISADFPEADADRLAVRQHGVITLADQVGKQFKATVVQVDPTGTSDGTMVRYGVLLAFDDAPEDLLVGQSASVKVTTGAKPEVLRVPSTAVHDVRGAAGTVLKDGAQVRVGVGLRGDQYTEITSGLAEGDTVVRSW